MESTNMEKPVIIEWEGHGQSLTGGLWSLLKENFMVDTKLNYREERHRIHRLIVAIFLPAFAHASDLSMDSLVANDEDVETLIEFMYTGKLTVSRSSVKRLELLANVLNFDGLTTAIKELSLRSASKAGTFEESKKYHICDMALMKELDKDLDIATPEVFVDDFDPVDIVNATKCDKCKQSFLTLDSFLNHTCPDNVEVPFHSSPSDQEICTCGHWNCTFVATSEEELRKHDMDEHTHVKTRGKEKSSTTSLIKKVKPYRTNRHTCSICGRQYARKASLDKHLGHHSRAQYSCGKCGHACTSKEYLEFHMSWIHNDSQ